MCTGLSHHVPLPPHLQNKALRERLHASQAATEENAKLRADVQQLCQQMVGGEEGRAGPQAWPCRQC